MKKRETKPTKEIKLDRETIRHLDDRKLEQAAGGGILRPYLPTQSATCG